MIKFGVQVHYTSKSNMHVEISVLVMCGCVFVTILVTNMWQYHANIIMVLINS